MEFKIGVVGTYGCPSFRNELRIHVISHMMRVVVTNRMFSKIANIRHGVWMKRDGRAQLPLLVMSRCCLLLTRCLLLKVLYKFHGSTNYKFLPNSKQRVNNKQHIGGVHHQLL